MKFIKIFIEYFNLLFKNKKQKIKITEQKSLISKNNNYEEFEEIVNKKYDNIDDKKIQKNHHKTNYKHQNYEKKKKKLDKNKKKERKWKKKQEKDSDE